jgi:hypothetical protein
LQCDRDLADLLELRFPGTARSTAEARAFTVRAVTWCARRGIAQFIVPEPGLPLPGVAEAARAVIPGARVAYVVTDESETPYARAAARCDDVTAAVIAGGDPAALLAGPADLLGDPALTKVINLAEPACAVLTVTALLTGEQAALMTAGFAERLAPGSALVMSSWVPPAESADRYAAAVAPAACLSRHTADDLAGWLSGGRLSLVEPPGVTDVRWWRAGMRGPRLRHHPRATAVAGAVAMVS